MASRNYEQMQLMRRGNSPLLSRFKVWISIYKFEYAPKYGLSDENSLLLTQQEDCSGILRIWDGPIRELPHCKDPDWYERFFLCFFRVLLNLCPFPVPVRRNPIANTVRIRHI